MGGHRCQVSRLALEPLLERHGSQPALPFALRCGSAGHPKPPVWQARWEGRGCGLGWYFLPQALARVGARPSAPLGTLPQVTHPGLSVLPW